MKKKSRLKTPLLVLAICSGVLFVAFLVCFFVGPYTSLETSSANYDLYLLGNLLGLQSNDWIKNSHDYLFDALKLPFDSQGENMFRDGSNYFFGEGVALSLSLIIYVLGLLMLASLILGLIFVIIKRKPLLTIYSLCILGVLYVSALTIANGGFWLKQSLSYFELDKQQFSGALGYGIGNLALIVLAGLLFLTVIATAIVGLVYAAKSSKKELISQEEAAPSIAEVAGDPEAIQEGEELSAPENNVVLIPEPEPVKEEEAAPEVEPEAASAEEPAPEEPKVEEEPAEDKHVEVNVNNGLDQASLASLLREVVRDIVRDEIARNNINQPQQSQNPQGSSQNITGATFGGPLVVQYFNGGINGVAAPAPAVAPAPAPLQEPVKEEPKAEEPAPLPEPVKEEPKVEEPAPRPLFVKKEEVAPADPKVEAKPEEKKYERLTFGERLLQSDKELHELYNEIKNEILSWGVKSRISANGDTFRLHKKMYVRITVAGKSLKLYFALNPADYANGTIPVQDASNKEMYQEIPLVFKVKSPLSVRRCKELIQDVMEKDGLEQGEVGKVNWIKELKAELANDAKKEKKKEE